MEVHLIDGTYELFRHFFAVPSARESDGTEIGAVRGVVNSIRAMSRTGATHIAVATDQVIESFRNRLWPGYKTGTGIDPALLAQFPILEEALTAFGVQVWPMVEYEADDALASGAAAAAKDERVKRILICTPDKDLAQCVQGTRVVQLDRRKQLVRDESGVIERFGVAPQSIPDYLALVGDTADGYPGLKGWGAKSAATVLSRFQHLEKIPEDARAWGVSVGNSSGLAALLREEREKVMLFRDLATLRTEIPLFDSIDDLRWEGPRPEFAAMQSRFDAAITAKSDGPRPARA